MWFFWVIATLAKCSVVFSFFQIFDFGWECPIEGVVGESFGVWKPTKNKFHSFSPPKGTGRREWTSFGTLDIKIGLSVWTVQVSKDLKGNLSIYLSQAARQCSTVVMAPCTLNGRSLFLVHPVQETCGPIAIKIVWVNYVGVISKCANFDWNRFTGVVSAKGWNMRLLCLFKPYRLIDWSIDR